MTLPVCFHSNTRVNCIRSVPKRIMTFFGVQLKLIKMEILYQENGVNVVQIVAVFTQVHTCVKSFFMLSMTNVVFLSLHVHIMCQ